MRRTDFPILQETVHGRPLVYLDNAATTQKPQIVTNAIAEAYAHWNANVHRGVHKLSLIATEKHEAAREKVRAFLHAAKREEIVFTRGTTESLNLLAFCLGEILIQAGDEIVLSVLEHHSNIVPWQMMTARKGATIRVIPLKDNALDMDEYKRILSSGKVKIVSVAAVSNVLGIRNDVHKMARLAHAAGAVFSVDAAQAVAHEPIDVQDWDCDFLSFSGHKIYAPTGIGVLYGKEEWLNRMPPYQGGGEMIDHVRFSGTTYNALPYKFEAGTPNYVGSHALGVALDYVQDIGLQQIAAHEKELLELAEAGLKEIDGVQIYAAGAEKHGAISFNVDGIHPYDIGVLLDQQGVAVRTGHHCAEPLIDSLGVVGTVRLSVALYNEKEDIALFLKALRRALSLLKNNREISFPVQ